MALWYINFYIFHPIVVNIATANSAHAVDTFEFNLTCLPECEHYDYPFEVALGMRSETVQIHGVPSHNDVNLENCSILNVFFNDLVSTRYRRDVYLNWQNILANFGGLLGLILGFTLISGFDLILFFVLHVIYDGIKTIITNKSNANNKIHVKDIKKRDVLKKKCVKKSKGWRNIGDQEINTLKNTKY